MEEEVWDVEKEKSKIKKMTRHKVDDEIKKFQREK